MPPDQTAAAVGARFATLVIGVGTLLQQLNRAAGSPGCGADSNVRSVLTALLPQWPHAPAVRHVVPAGLPVLRCLPLLEQHAAANTTPVVRNLIEVAAACCWRQTYGRGEADAAFLDSYGWTELVGLNGPVASRGFACGLLLLAAGTDYPSHHHEPEELYIPLSGTALWQQGARQPVRRAPGSVIHHGPGEPHAMRTESQPLLALYLWSGSDLQRPARWVAAGPAQHGGAEP
jgi:mannose-6-phosphate isomerase-like protein (cupin superfamily)